MILLTIFLPLHLLQVSNNPEHHQLITRMTVVYPPPSSPEYSIEEGGVKHHSAPGELYNDTVQSYRWDNLSAILPAKGKKPLKHLLQSMSGEARAGMWFYHPLGSD